MGLFGSLISGLTGGGILGDLLGGASNANAVNDASQAQLQATKAAIGAQQQQYYQTRQDYTPYRNAGTAAVGAMSDLLGIGGGPATGPTTDWASYVMGNPDLAAEWAKVQGYPQFNGNIGAYGQWHYNTYGQNEGRNLSPYTTPGTTATTAAQAQQAAIDQLKASPQFTSQYNQGLDAILQSAAATGGLRGGNTQNSLANFGSSLLGSTIQSQLANLSGVANQGLGAVGGTSAAGSASAGNTANLLSQQGAISAGNILGQQAVWNNTSQNIASTLQNIVGGGMKF